MKIISVDIPDGLLLYNEGGVVVYNPEEDLLSLIETKNISNVSYEFDRKHLGSVSGSKSNAGAGAIGAILGVVIGGLISDSDIDIGDAAKVGIVGALVGGSNKRQHMQNEYEEHATVDVYTNCNDLPHFEVDFGPQQKPAKRFYAYIQNLMNGGAGPTGVVAEE